MQWFDSISVLQEIRNPQPSHQRSDCRSRQYWNTGYDRSQTETKVPFISRFIKQWVTIFHENVSKFHCLLNTLLLMGPWRVHSILSQITKQEWCEWVELVFTWTTVRHRGVRWVKRAGCWWKSRRRSWKGLNDKDWQCHNDEWRHFESEIW